MDLFQDAFGRALELIWSLDAYIIDVFLRSMRVSGAAVLLGLLIGLPAGIFLALSRFRGRGLAIALLHTGFALPPVVVGLFVYMLLSRSGPMPGLELLFTPAAMIIAQAILATPYVAGITLSAVQAVPSTVRLEARALGAGRWRSLAAHLREARLGLVAAVVAGFGAVISEVGAVLMVGGNVEGETRVLTTAIMLETRRGDFGAALAMGLILLAIAFAVNAGLTRLQQGAAAPARAPWR
ncbi:MAG TPA: ABC transporter permease [Longimicrobiales bacterium]|nr:ABC transporter permease [Longimicrobiales bacterium]